MSAVHDAVEAMKAGDSGVDTYVYAILAQKNKAIGIG
jgi:hypothetical protein